MLASVSKCTGQARTGPPVQYMCVELWSSAGTGLWTVELPGLVVAHEGKMGKVSIRSAGQLEV